MKRYTSLLAIVCGLMRVGTLNAADPHTFVPDIVAADFSAHVQVLASDDLGGREPGSESEEKTLRYLRDQFQRMGLLPGNGDSYFQTVPMQVRLADVPNSHAAIELNGQTLALALGPQVVLGSDLGRSEVSVADSPMIFVGYGIHAPEHQWNDYADASVRGKTVLVLSGEPSGESGGREFFEGRRLTHYSRLIYKVEEAARRGAVAAIVIHDTASAGYDWEGVKARWRNEFALRPADRSQPLVAVQGWMSGARARALLSAAGMNLSELRDAAGRRPFKAVPVGDARFSATLAGKVLLGKSNNAIARLAGTTHPDEAILYSAHWDHLGTQQRKAKDQIYNGALDNATGVAVLLEIAERFATQEPKPERSILFLIPTLEELGMLGSAYYISHPVIPLGQTVADINFDMVVPIGRARNFVVIGLGYSELDDVVAPIVARLGRTLSAENSSTDANHFLRSDHANFAKAGVPVLYMRGGVESGIGRSKAARDATWYQVASVYHTPDDEFDPQWDLQGVVEDAEVSYQVGRTLAGSRDWPNYRAGNAYRAARDAARAGSIER